MKERDINSILVALEAVFPLAVRYIDYRKIQAIWEKISYNDRARYIHQIDGEENPSKCEAASKGRNPRCKRRDYPFKRDLNLKAWPVLRTKKRGNRFDSMVYQYDINKGHMMWKWNLGSDVYGTGNDGDKREKALLKLECDDDEKTPSGEWKGETGKLGDNELGWCLDEEYKLSETIFNNICKGKAIHTIKSARKVTDINTLCYKIKELVVLEPAAEFLQENMMYDFGRVWQRRKRAPFPPILYLEQDEGIVALDGHLVMPFLNNVVATKLPTNAFDNSQWVNWSNNYAVDPTSWQWISYLQYFVRDDFFFDFYCRFCRDSYSQNPWEKRDGEEDKKGDIFKWDPRNKTLFKLKTYPDGDDLVKIEEMLVDTANQQSVIDNNAWHYFSKAGDLNDGIEAPGLLEPNLMTGWQAPAKLEDPEEKGKRLKIKKQQKDEAKRKEEERIIKQKGREREQAAAARKEKEIMAEASRRKAAQRNRRNKQKQKKGSSSANRFVSPSDSRNRSTRRVLVSSARSDRSRFGGGKKKRKTRRKKRNEY
jgi:hypothetical protein